MSQHTATVRWEKGSARFIDGRYSRAHRWEFDGGAVVPGSSSPHSVPKYSDAAAVDPEEAFIAALASCHMLWFLSIASKRGFCIVTYSDTAEGLLAPNGQGKLYIKTVTLNPHVVFEGTEPPPDSVVREMHDQAHHECFIANSVLTEVITNATFETRPLRAGLQL
jgi:organic hydroperoxide reductase OsmC/OhrA